MPAAHVTILGAASVICAAHIAFAAPNDLQGCDAIQARIEILESRLHQWQQTQETAFASNPRIDVLIDILAEDLAHQQTLQLFFCPAETVEPPRDPSIVQDLSDGGDEIIIAGPADGRAPAGQPSGPPQPDFSNATPFVFANADFGTETNGWEIVLEWEGTVTEHRRDPEEEYQNRDLSFRLTVGDNGLLYYATALDRTYGTDCRLNGDIVLQGNRFRASFSGLSGNDAELRDATVVGRIGQVTSESTQVPIGFGSATWTLWNNSSGEQMLSAEATNIHDGRRSHMTRITLPAHLYDAETRTNLDWCPIPSGP